MKKMIIFCIFSILSCVPTLSKFGNDIYFIFPAKIDIEALEKDGFIINADDVLVASKKGYFNIHLGDSILVDSLEFFLWSVKPYDLFSYSLLVDEALDNRLQPNLRAKDSVKNYESLDEKIELSYYNFQGLVWERRHSTDKASQSTSVYYHIYAPKK